MAKTRKVVKKKAGPKTEVTTTQDVPGNGTVKVGMGIKVSANYQTQSFDVEVALPLGPKEHPEDGLNRALVHCRAFVQDAAKEFNEVLGEQIQKSFRSLDASAKEVKEDVKRGR